MLRSNNGITTIEYSILVLVLVLALLAIQVSLKRVIAGKWKVSADVFGAGRQYEPNNGITTISPI